MCQTEWVWWGFKDWSALLQGDLKLEVSFGAVTLCCVVSFINKQNAINCASLEGGGNVWYAVRGTKEGLYFCKHLMLERCNPIPNSVPEILTRNGRNPSIPFFQAWHKDAPASCWLPLVAVSCSASIGGSVTLDHLDCSWSRGLFPPPSVHCRCEGMSCFLPLLWAVRLGRLGTASKYKLVTK